MNFKATMIDSCANKLKFKLFVITKNNLEPLPSVFELTAINVIKNKLKKVKNLKSKLLSNFKTHATKISIGPIVLYVSQWFNNLKCYFWQNVACDGDTTFS